MADNEPMMTGLDWGKSYRTKNVVFKYIDDTTLRLSEAQKGLREETFKQTRSMMLSDASEIQLLQNLLLSRNAKKALDIGVYTGYSAMGLALALPKDGIVVACDIDDKMPSIGKPFWKQAGVDSIIDLRIGPAADTLNELLKNGEAETFDMAFIDADKTGYDVYYELSLQLLKKGGIIAIDNALWDGKVVDSSQTDEDTVAIRNLNEKVGKDNRVNASLLLVGDGTMLAFKK